MSTISVRNIVTGGAGFLGSHLIDKLMKNGEEVKCLDDFSTGKKYNLQKWLDHPSFELINHDITDPIILEADKIWHLACPAAPIHYQTNPIKTAKTSFIGTHNMLELSKKVKAKFLFASTSEVYGDPEVHPQPENYKGSVNPIGIRSCYEEGKRIAETLCFDYQRLYEVEIKVMRIFNTYGPRMLPNDGRVISNFIVQALNGKSLTVFGDGSQTRSFCFVDDLINGMVLLMNSDQTGPINIGNPNEKSIKEIAILIKNIINPNLDIIFEPLPQDDPKRRKPAINLAKKMLNWEPAISLELGLLKTIDYFKNIN